MIRKIIEINSESDPDRKSIEFILLISKKENINYFKRLNFMSEDENSITGRWTNEEHEKFLLGTYHLILGLQLYGKDWKKIEGLIGSRSCSQVRSHAQKYFLKLKK